jgi:outer membrane protein assembly factor BamC
MNCKRLKWILPRLMVAGLTLAGVGCGTDSGNILPDRKVDYKKQRVAEQDLEVPPDLTRGTIDDTMQIPGGAGSGTAVYSQYAEDKRLGRPGSYNKGGEVLPSVENITVKRDGDQRWLEILSPPEEVWPRVISFWRQSNVLLLEQDPTVGVMKTDWLENRADIKQGMLTDFFRKALDSLHSAGTRDQFRVRLEPGRTDGSTDLYLTHRGMEEKMVTTAGGDSENGVWIPRPNDPGLEAEMLRRLMVYLGVAEQQAASELISESSDAAARTQMIKGRDGLVSLLINAEYASAWRQVGVALERVGFAVEDRDRTEGVYYVRYDDPTRQDESGFLDKLAFWRDKENINDQTQYRVKLIGEGETSRVVVLNQAGERDDSDTGERILTLIQEQLR